MTDKLTENEVRELIAKCREIETITEHGNNGITAALPGELIDEFLEESAAAVSSLGQIARNYHHDRNVREIGKTA